MGRKQIFTAHDLVTMVDEMKREGLVGSYVQNCFDSGFQGIVIKLSAKIDGVEGRKKLILRMESAQRMHLIDEFTAIRQTPTGFCAKIRKHLRDRRVIDMEMVNGDRVIDFTFGSREEGGFHLILELYASGNIILTDHTYKIMMLLHRHNYENSKVTMGQIYPKEEATIDPARYEVTDDDLSSWLSERVKEVEKTTKVRQLLTSSDSPVSVFGPVMIDHALATLGSKNMKVRKGDSVPDLTGFIRIVKAIHTTPGTDPMIILNDDGSFDTFVPELYRHLQEKNYQKFPSFNAAVTAYFKEVDEERKKKSKGEKVVKEKPKERKIDQQLTQLTAKRDKAYDLIELMTCNMDVIERFLKGYSLGVVDLPLKVLDIDGEKKLVYVEIEGERVELDTKLSSHANLDRLYTTGKTLKYKQQRTEEVKQKLDKQEQKTAKKDSGVDTTGLADKPRQYWFQKYNWFYTSEGLMVVSGKTAQQNEELVKKYMEDHDIYIHSDVAGSGSGVIKCPEKQVPGPKSLEEAACFIICHTKAWLSGAPDKAWWVYPRQVSKTTQAGEYVGMGSFIIRDRKNYLPLPKLELGFTLLYKNKENQALSPESTADLEFAIPMVAPYGSIKSRLRCKITPGTLKAGKAVKKISEGIRRGMRPLEREALKRIPNDEMNKVMVTKVKIQLPR